jgi:hypothetical protein
MSPTQRLAAVNVIVAHAVTDLCRADNQLTPAKAAYLVTRAGMCALREHKGNNLAAEDLYALADECVGGF